MTEFAEDDFLGQLESKMQEELARGQAYEGLQFVQVAPPHAPTQIHTHVHHA